MKIQFVHRENGEVVERGNVLDVLAIDGGWYRIVDDMGDECLLPPSMFEVVEQFPEAPIVDSAA